MIWTIIIILFLLWIFGFSFEIGGQFVHSLLVVALLVLIVKLLV